ncbi:MAG TPA: LD-carboxypeptidase [Puia sp.]|nr:LD-carboxypeptidase [Puia sp.]
MNRKNFLTSLAGFAVMRGPGALPNARRASPQPLLIPPYLKAGDRIGITCPAGDITLKDIEPAVQMLESWGFRTVAGNTIGKKDFIFGGTDAERTADFQEMLDNPDIHAILCARGGYGSVHIVDQLNFSPLLQNPKWIIGFSDITVLLSHIHTNLHIAGIHSKMCNSFPDDMTTAEPGQAASILSIRQAMAGEKMSYTVAPQPMNRPGTATGQLVGGNLKTIESIAGTVSDIDTAGKILFLEDTDEYLYSIDRMFWHLQRTGKLDRIAGLIVGGFNVRPDDPGEEFGRSIYDIVTDRVKLFNYPVCFDFPVGHQKENYALKHGVPHTLTVTTALVQLSETANTVLP